MVVEKRDDDPVIIGRIERMLRELEARHGIVAAPLELPAGISLAPAG